MAIAESDSIELVRVLYEPTIYGHARKYGHMQRAKMRCADRSAANERVFKLDDDLTGLAIFR